MIAQRGTHHELLQSTGPYREIYDLQLKPQESAMVNGTKDMQSIKSQSAKKSQLSSKETPSSEGAR